VEFGGVAAPVYFISPGQIDVQVPEGLSGTVPVAVNVNGTQSAQYLIAVVQIAPSLFEYAGGSVLYAAATHADGSLIGDPSVTPNTTPAVSGETVEFYVNGLDASTSGTIISSVVPDNNPVSVTIGSLQASVRFQGLIEAGLFQLNVVVPAGLATRAFPIFNDLAPNNSGAGYCISGTGTANCGPMTSRWIAAPFVAGGDFTLTQVDLSLGWISGTNGAVVDLVNDASGVPGSAVLTSWTVSQLPPSGPTALVTLTPPTSVTLNRAARYWLVVKGAASDTLDFWSGNASGLTGALTSLDEGASWNNGFLNLGAFEVLGTPLSGNVPAPVVVTAGGVSSQAGAILPVSGK
jgi:uncharacterized protein (TIGR03437 family)